MSPICVIIGTHLIGDPILQNNGTPGHSFNGGLATLFYESEKKLCENVEKWESSSRPQKSDKTWQSNYGLYATRSSHLTANSMQSEACMESADYKTKLGKKGQTYVKVFFCGWVTWVGGRGGGIHVWRKALLPKHWIIMGIFVANQGSYPRYELNI